MTTTAAAAALLESWSMESRARHGESMFMHGDLVTMVSDGGATPPDEPPAPRWYPPRHGVRQSLANHNGGNGGGGGRMKRSSARPLRIMCLSYDPGHPMGTHPASSRATPSPPEHHFFFFFFFFFFFHFHFRFRAALLRDRRELQRGRRVAQPADDPRRRGPS